MILVSDNVKGFNNIKFRIGCEDIGTTHHLNILESRHFNGNAKPILGTMRGGMWKCYIKDTYIKSWMNK
jgi:hypothetical protein